MNQYHESRTYRAWICLIKNVASRYTMPSLMGQSQIPQQEGWGWFFWTYFAFPSFPHIHIYRKCIRRHPLNSHLRASQKFMPTIKLLLIRHGWLLFSHSTTNGHIKEPRISLYVPQHSKRRFPQNEQRFCLSSLKHMEAHWSLVRKLPCLKWLVWDEAERIKCLSCGIFY